MATRKATKPLTIKAGECPCGMPIMIAERYALNVNGPTTIKRKCPGYQCGRTNEVVMRARFEVQRATWKVLDCRCGAAIHLRSDYAGVGFTGWDREGKTGSDLMVHRRGDNKNRTVKMSCPQCDCAYTIVIRFERRDGQEHRTIPSAKVHRCAGCRHRTDTVAV